MSGADRTPGPPVTPRTEPQATPPNETQVVPLVLAPRFERRVWGGGRLPGWVTSPAEGAVAPDQGGDDRGVAGPPGEPIGECWLAGDDNRVVGGPYGGLALRDVVSVLGAELVGSVPYARYGARMPILAKLLDAAADLSVQVHPDDAYALEHERASGHLGKSEAWYVLEADPRAAVLWGFRRDVTESEVRDAVRGGTLPSLMHRVTVRRGDVVLNPAGTVHAILSGVLAFEIQQSSDLTYRLYDYGRLAADGRPRALHVDKALAVADLRGGEPNMPSPRQMPDGWVRLVQAAEFTMDRFDLGAGDAAAVTSANAVVRDDAAVGRLGVHGKEASQARVATGATDAASLEILTLLGDRGTLVAADASIPLAQGTTVVLPAALGQYRVTGSGEVIRCAVAKDVFA